LTADTLRLPPFELAHAVLMMRGLAASHVGLAPGVVQSCLPIIVPFSLPEMNPSAWFANKRALAYNRCIIVTVYVQGVCAALKLMSGNMIGGFFDGIQAGMGYYSLSPDGTRFLPTYMMMAGLNGVVALLQVLQRYHGVPLHYLPWSQVAMPVASILSAYFSWEFCRELRAIATGLPSGAAQDSCIVKVMGGDWWPAMLSAPSYGLQHTDWDSARHEDSYGGGRQSGINFGSFGPGGVGSRFSVFEGSGHRLGES